MARDEWRQGAYLAEFGRADLLETAIEELEGYGYTMMESYSPFPVNALEGRRRRSRLPVGVFVVGAIGAVASYWVQWLANVHFYPLNIGGRPAHSVAAFVIPTFEGTVLAASLAVFIGLWAILGLPHLSHPLFELEGFERTSNDRFWLAIDARDPRSDPTATPNELRDLGALRVERWEPH